jgi:hypothetical protein
MHIRRITSKVSASVIPLTHSVVKKLSGVVLSRACCLLAGGLIATAANLVVTHPSLVVMTKASQEQ